MERTDEQRRADAAARQRRQRGRRPDKPRASHQRGAGNVVSLPTAQQPAPPAAEPVLTECPVCGVWHAGREMGPNERATCAELGLTPKAKLRPGIAADVITMAQQIDNPAMAAVRAQSSRQKQALLHELQGPRKKSGGRLATVSAMAGRRRAQ